MHEDFRKEFVINMLIGFTVAEVVLLYLFKKIGGFEFLVTAVPFLLLYFISKAGFYKYTLSFGGLFLYGIACIPLFGPGKNSFASVISIILLLIIIFALSGVFRGIFFFLLFALTIVISKNMPTLFDQRLEPVSQFMFFPLCTGVALCVGWLPNQRIKEALRKIRRAEYLLKKERNMLDLRLKQRTESLFKLADLGTLTQRLIHDISTPLNILFLNMAQITPHNIKQTQEAIKRAQYGTEVMGKYVEEVRDKIKNQDTKVWFEMLKILEITKYMCETNNVEIQVKGHKNLQVFGNESKFLQIIINLTQNSVEACEGRGGLVYIETLYLHDSLKVIIEDNGKGMDQAKLENLGKFTTKKDSKLNGIGYETASELAETDFDGKVHTESTTDRGTKTTVVIKSPIRVCSDRAHRP